MCKFKTNDVFVNLNESKEVSDNFNLKKIIKNHFFGNLDLLLENSTDPFLGQLIY